MKSVLIVGYGIVGKNLHKELERLQPDIYDKYASYFNTKKNIKYDFAFICVDTPYVKQEYPENDIPNDVSEIKIALQENEADIYIIKSAILPYTAENLAKQFNKKIVVSPEYYGNTPNNTKLDFNFTILGGEKENCYKVQQLLQEVYNSSHTFKIYNYRTAELAKYMENCGIAMKVSFCIMFYKVCKQIGVNYEDLRECFIADPRFSSFFTYVFEDHPYWDSKCLNKDTKAITSMFEMELLEAMIKFNEKQKDLYK